jgi:hypothetical protein
MPKIDLNYWANKLSPILPKHLVTEEVVALRDEQNKALALMGKKNHDYGNAFNKGCDALGDEYAFCRMWDKLSRLQTLIKGVLNRELSIEVQDETIDDTVADLANYCMMYLAWKNKNKIITSSTGGLDDTTDDEIDNSFYLCEPVSTGKTKFVEESTGKDVTVEVIENYGLSALYADEGGYVFNVTTDGDNVAVTSESQDKVRAIRSDKVKEYQRKCKCK